MHKFIYVSSFLFFCSSFSFAQSGKPDPSFGREGIVTTDMGLPFDNNSAARQVLLQPDGSIYIIFNFPTFISKRFPNGSPDSSYGINGYSRLVPFNNAYAALQPDGKIVIAGIGFNIARINTNGTPDSTFGNNGMQTGFNAESYASSVAIQADGKIAVAGTAWIGGDSYFGVARYNTNGSPDYTFNGSGELVTDFGFKAPANIEGSDSVPIHQQSATTIAIQANGKIVAGGYAFNGLDNDFAIARYNEDGSPDNTFDNDSRQTTKIGSSDDFGYSLAIQNDGKIILAGYTSFESVNNFAIVRYNVNGTPDNSFNGNGKQKTTSLISDAQIPNSVAIQSSGKIIVAGYTSNGTDNDFAIARFNTNGNPDNTFGNNGILTTDFTSSDDYSGFVAIQSDDKIIVAGYSYIYNPGLTVQHLAVSRYNPDGSLDNSFAGNGKLHGLSGEGYTKFNTSALQGDGKLVTAGISWNGKDYDFAVARFNIDGSLDSTFSDDGKQITDFGVTDEAVSEVIQPDGKIIVAGNSDNQFAIVRYNTDGSPDNTFGQAGKLTSPIGLADVLKSVALQNDGKIVLAGYTITGINFDSVKLAIARLNSDGTPDNTFGDNGKVLNDFGVATSVAIQNDGKIVVAGRINLDNTDNFSLSRYNTDGSLDATFSDDGKQNNVFGTDNYFAESLAIQNDGKIVVAGSSETSSGNSSSFVVARYKTNGELDDAFNGGGFQSTYMGGHFNFGISVVVDKYGRIAVGGTNDNFAIALYRYDGSPDNNFGVNGVLITKIGIAGSSIQNLAFADNKLYAAGSGEFPATLGVVARYLLAEGGLLPVSFLDFQAFLQSKTVLLKWKIVTTKNLTGFVIERSADGNSFMAINNVKTSGMSAFTRNYSTMDEQPLQGINFYRLKMVDVDGKFTYSNIVAIKLNAEIKLKIFPNPAERILFVEANGSNEDAVVQIIDGGGRKLKEGKVFLNGKTSFSLDINSLPHGIYNLVLHKKERTEVQMFIKK